MHETIAALVTREGWRAEGEAARVHYAGAGDQFAVEYYAPTEAVLYWSVPVDCDANDDDRACDARWAGTAAPIPREAVPEPLRKRVRADLSAAGVDPAVERRPV